VPPERKCQVTHGPPPRDKVYSFLFVLRIIAAPHDKRAGYSYAGYFCSFFGVADALAFVPFYIQVCSHDARPRPQPRAQRAA